MLSYAAAYIYRVCNAIDVMILVSHCLLKFLSKHGATFHFKCTLLEHIGVYGVRELCKIKSEIPCRPISGRIEASLSLPSSVCTLIVSDKDNTSFLKQHFKFAPRLNTVDFESIHIMTILQ